MQSFLLFVLLNVASDPVTVAPPGVISCENPPPNDARPYTLCLAEAEFERAKANLDRQLKITIAQVEVARGASAANRLRDEQLKWVKLRDSECEALAGESPSTQVGRNEMSCLAQRTEARTAEIMALAAATQYVAPAQGDPNELAQNLREVCMSEQGVGIVVEAISKQRQSQEAQQRHLNALNAELGAAADTIPLNIGRLRTAAEARDLYRYQMDRETTAQTMAILERLSANDRAIFAWQLDLNFARFRIPRVSCKSP